MPQEAVRVVFSIEVAGASPSALAMSTSNSSHWLVIWQPLFPCFYPALACSLALAPWPHTTTFVPEEWPVIPQGDIGSFGARLLLPFKASWFQVFSFFVLLLIQETDCLLRIVCLAFLFFVLHCCVTFLQPSHHFPRPFRVDLDWSSALVTFLLCQDWFWELANG